MNGATEATLAELLATAQAMNANLVTLQRLASQGGGGSSPAAASSAANAIAAATSPARIALGALSVAGNMISGLFSAMGNIIGKVVGGLVNTAGNLFNFAKQAASGTAKLSDFYDAFRDLPFLVGTVASIFADIIRYSEGLLTTYRDLTKYGASFSGDLFKMANAATRGFMSLDEFSKVVRTNSDVLSTLGGDVDKGMNKFVDIQNKLLGPGSQYSKSLLGLGYTASDTADMLSAVINQQGNLNKKELANNDTVAASVNNIAKEMDLYSKVTGKSREELEKELKKKSFDAAWKTFTAGMTTEQAASASLAVEKAMATGGQGAADALRQMFMTGGEISTPITDASKQFYIQTNGAAEDYVKTMYNSALNMKTGSQAQLEAQLRAGRDIGQAYSEFIGPMGKTAGLFSVMGNNFINNAALMTSSMKFSKLTNDEITKMALEAGKKQAVAAQGNAAGLAQAELNIKNFGMTIMNLVNQIIGPIAGELIKFGSTITNYLAPIMTKVASWLTTAFTELKTAFGGGGENGFKNMFAKLGDKLQEAAGNIADFVKPIWKALEPVMTRVWTEYVRPALASIFTGMMDFIIAALRKNSRIARWLFNETDTEKSEREKNESDPLYQAILAREQERVSRENEVAFASGGMASYVDNEEVMKQFLAERERQRRLPPPPAPVNPRDRRHSGTIGMTGNWWEKEDASLNIQAGETVVTESQMDQIVNTASQKGLAEAIQRLNTTQNTMVAVLKQIANASERNVAATKDLNGNLWAA
jgi:hypothetical protein